MKSELAVKSKFDQKSKVWAFKSHQGRYNKSKFTVVTLSDLRNPPHWLLQDISGIAMAQILERMVTQSFPGLLFLRKIEFSSRKKGFL